MRSVSHVVSYPSFSAGAYLVTARRLYRVNILLPADRRPLNTSLKYVSETSSLAASAFCDPSVSTSSRIRPRNSSCVSCFIRGLAYHENAKTSKLRTFPVGMIVEGKPGIFRPFLLREFVVFGKESR